MTHRTLFLLGSLLLAVMTASAAEDRKARVLNDRVEVKDAGKWIYNDLPTAIAEATTTGKPMLVVFRCVP